MVSTRNSLLPLGVHNALRNAVNSSGRLPGMDHWITLGFMDALDGICRTGHLTNGPSHPRAPLRRYTVEARLAAYMKGYDAALALGRRRGA